MANRPTIEKSSPQAGSKRSKLNLRFILSEIDLTFFGLVVLLTVFGLLMMFSASFAASMQEHGDSYYIIKRQLLCAIIGFVAMFFASYLDYNFFFNTKIAYFFFGVSLVTCIYTALWGIEVADAKRWIKIPKVGVTFQPSEMLKIAFIVIFAYILSVNFQKFEKKPYYIYIPFYITFGLVFIVLLMQRHMSAVMLFTIIGVAMLFASGMSRKRFWQFMMVSAFLGLIALLVLFVVKGGGKFSYIITRYKAWKNPMADTSDTTHQTYESLLAIGSGGWFGLGFGESRQKYLYLPESQNDFIFAIICEELGFAGGLVVVLLFVLFILKGFQIATSARDRFGMLVATGITIQIGIQALLNIMVATNGFPNTGVALPFFSAGGTAIILQMFEMGIMLSISRQTIKRGTKKKKAQEKATAQKPAEA
ncbi:cell division protein FtsW [Ruminococcus sp. YE71]|uniref:FtsW/RodA/SpoVE family cell cycle protein n=1 Tax=unclassified Ruminococcus TaxID=2608920 RepID=UPI000882A544|nr:MULTISPECIES: putative peptidoglycan glycosyltransferase FtsW [unclassified Ruminococcus]SDA11923.1 cell division protein FtsW [Ruminococcus sp. YE78]SFW15960.1 cell division protein FtsW [Ruminococcus sp. YE71]